MAPSDLESAVQLPRLSIIELMVLTASMAIAVAFHETFADMESDFVWFDAIRRTYYALINGLPIAAFYRFILQERICGKFLVHPGHWVLFGLLISVVGSMLPFAIQKTVGFADSIGGLPGNWHYLAFAMFNFVSAVVFFRGAMLWGWAWRAMLVLMAVSFLVYGIQTIAFVLLYGSWTSGGGSQWVFAVFDWTDISMKILLLIALIPVLWTELKTTKRRDPWHWAGIVVLFLMNFVSPALDYVYVYFLIL